MNEDLKLSVFANLQSYNSKAVGMDEIVRMVRHDIIVKNKTLGYRAMAKTISKAEANKNIKEKIVEAFSVAVLFNGTGKKPEHVVGFTGLAMCDLDEVADVEQARRLITSDPHTLLFYESISKKGLPGDLPLQERGQW